MCGQVVMTAMNPEVPPVEEETVRSVNKEMSWDVVCVFSLSIPSTESVHSTLHMAYLY